MTQPRKSYSGREDWSWAGFSCRAAQHPSLGHWCGYVGLDKGHRAFEHDYDDIDLADGVHGGLTWAGPFSDDGEGLWWLGFDCGHSGDFVPGAPHMGDTFRDLDYVKHETELLAEQLAHDRFKIRVVTWL